MPDTSPASPDQPGLDRANIFRAVEHGLLDANTATLMLLRLGRERQQARADRVALDLLVRAQT